MLLSLGKKTPKTQHSIVEDCLEFHNIGHCPSSCTYLSNHVKEESYKSTYTIRVHITFSISLVLSRFTYLYVFYRCYDF